MGMYDVFDTDADLENDGIWIDYGDFRVRIAGATQGNKKYVTYADKALKPIRRAMAAGALSPERSRIVMIDIYVKTIILDWEVKEDDKWKKGIESKTGDVLPVTKENISQALNDLPNLFIDLQEQAQQISNFRKAELEEESGN
jgi:hypothetical protein